MKSSLMNVGSTKLPLLLPVVSQSYFTFQFLKSGTLIPHFIPTTTWWTQVRLGVGVRKISHYRGKCTAREAITPFVLKKLDLFVNLLTGFGNLYTSKPYHCGWYTWIMWYQNAAERHTTNKGGKPKHQSWQGNNITFTTLSGFLKQTIYIAFSK